MDTKEDTINTDMTYICKRCGYGTCHKGNFVKHLRKTKECIPIHNDISRVLLYNELVENKTNAKKFHCTFCNKAFTDFSNRYRHQRECKDKDICDDEKSVILSTELEAFVKAKVDELMDEKISKIRRCNTQNNIIYNINNNNVNISSDSKTPRNFGFENMDAIPKSFIRDCFLNLDMKAIFENLHFDPNFPENHNVRIKSTKKQQIEMFTNDEWTIRPYKNGVNDIIRNLYRILNTYQRHNRNELYEDMNKDELNELLAQLEEIYKLSYKADEIRKELLCSMEQHRTHSIIPC